MLPGRLMAERMALDHVAKVRGPSRAANEALSPRVRTGGFQPSNRGSIPLALSLTYVMFLGCNVD